MAPLDAGISRGRKLAAARLAWLAALLLGLGLLGLNVGPRFDQYRTICPGEPCAGLQFSARQAGELRQLGVSLDTVADYLILLTGLELLVFVAVAAVIVWRKPDDGAALFTAFVLVTFGLGGALTPGPATLPAQRWLMLGYETLGNSSIVLFLLLFPDGHFAPGWARWLAPVAVGREWASLFVPNTVVDDLFIVIVPLILLAQIYRYRRVSNALQRAQTKWVVYGSVVGVGLYVALLLTLNTLTGREPLGSLPALALATGLQLSLALIPLSVGMAILRSRLWDIDLIIRRTLIYGALTALLALVYFGSVLALQAIFTAVTGSARSELVTVLSTLVIAALFVPARNRVQAVIDRRFYRRKYDAARTVAAFGNVVRDEVELDQLTERLTEVVEETLQPEIVNVWLKGRG
jgi:hypothetical protein